MIVLNHHKLTSDAKQHDDCKEIQRPLHLSADDVCNGGKGFRGTNRRSVASKYSRFVGEYFPGALLRDFGCRQKLSRQIS